jgi:hypothetical protein
MKIRRKSEEYAEDKKCGEKRIKIIKMKYFVALQFLNVSSEVWVTFSCS